MYLIFPVISRGHVFCFPCHSHSHSHSHSVFAMFILQLWTELEGKHCISLCLWLWQWQKNKIQNQSFSHLILGRTNLQMVGWNSTLRLYKDFVRFAYIYVAWHCSRNCIMLSKNYVGILLRCQTLKTFRLWPRSLKSERLKLQNIQKVPT